MARVARFDPNASPKINRSAIESVYYLGKTLGNGTFSVVKEGTHITEGVKYAIKVANFAASKSSTLEKEIMSELDFLSKISHPNIVYLKEFFETPKSVFVVMERMCGGELFDMINSLERFSEAEAAHLFSQMLSAVQFLHDHDIVHRDIKPENLLLTQQSVNTTIKLADFGFSCYLPKGNELHDFTGSRPYMAPEIASLRWRYNAQKGYDRAVDMWALGVILYILFSGINPFQVDVDDDEEMLDNIELCAFEFIGDSWDLISDQAKDLVQSLMHKNPKVRADADEASRHPWIRFARKKDLDIQKAREPLDSPKSYKNATPKKALGTPKRFITPVGTPLQLSNSSRYQSPMNALTSSNTPMRKSPSKQKPPDSFSPLRKIPGSPENSNKENSEGSIAEFVDVALNTSSGIDAVIALGAATGGIVLSGLASTLLHPIKLL